MISRTMLGLGALAGGFYYFRKSEPQTKVADLNPVEMLEELSTYVGEGTRKNREKWLEAKKNGVYTHPFPVWHEVMKKKAKTDDGVAKFAFFILEKSVEGIETVDCHDAPEKNSCEELKLGLRAHYQNCETIVKIGGVK